MSRAGSGKGAPHKKHDGSDRSARSVPAGAPPATICGHGLPGMRTGVPAALPISADAPTGKAASSSNGNRNGFGGLAATS